MLFIQGKLRKKKKKKHVKGLGMRLTSVLICYFMGNNCITDETGILYSMKKEKFTGSQIEDCPIFALEVFFLDGMV